MRLWTVHPKYLDAKGMVALWREALLAQKVLKGETRGYRNHPQLMRFAASPNPPGAIADYLRGVEAEAARRGYRFDAGKIDASSYGGVIACTRGQLLYEWRHLKEKLKARDARRYAELEGLDEPDCHALFRIVEGGVEPWEVV